MSLLKFFFQIRALHVISLFMNSTQKAGGNELPALVPSYSPIASLQLLVTARNTGFFILSTEHLLQGERV